MIHPEIIGYKHVNIAVDESLEMIRKISSGELVPLRFKLAKERERIGGLYPSDMMTIAARTGMGKTSKVVNLIQNFLDPVLNPHYVGKIIILFDSWEMVDWRMMMRMYSKVGKLTVKELLDYEVRLAAEKIALVNTLAEQFRGQPLYFVKSNRNVDQWVKSKERIQKQFPEHQIVNVTDHMRLVTRSNEKSEEQLITDFSKAQMYVKTSMGQICIPLSQMNRAIEQGGRGEELGNRLPIASDLFGSDAIFQCSDIVMALHRPGYYGLQYWNYGNTSFPTGISEDPDSTDTLMVECILKQRDGWTGNILVTHNLKYNDFIDYTEF